MMIRSCTRSRLIANHLNVLASAVLAATAQRPSEAIRLIEATPGGSGSLHLSGPFTGAQDSEIEAEILSLDGGAVVAGTPVTHGVGSGTLSVTALRAGASAETLELSRTNYSLGEGDFMTVLDAERSYLSAQQSAAAAEWQRAADFITLSIAAAGGLR